MREHYTSPATSTRLDLRLWQQANAEADEGDFASREATPWAPRGYPGAASDQLRQERP